MTVACAGSIRTATGSPVRGGCSSSARCARSGSPAASVTSQRPGPGETRSTVAGSSPADGGWIGWPLPRRQARRGRGRRSTAGRRGCRQCGPGPTGRCARATRSRSPRALRPWRPPVAGRRRQAPRAAGQSPRQDRHSVRKAQGLLRPVRHVHDRGRALGEGGLEVVEERLACLGVKPRGGLVEQQQPRVEGERPRETDSLRFATRQRPRPAVGELRDVEPFEGSHGRGSPRAPVDSPPSERQLDVANDARREQPGALRGVADAVPGAQACVGGRDPVDGDRSGRRRVERGEQSKQCRLAGTIRPEHCEPLTRGKVELVDRQDLAASAAVAEIADLQD